MPNDDTRTPPVKIMLLNYGEKEYTIDGKYRYFSPTLLFGPDGGVAAIHRFIFQSTCRGANGHDIGDKSPESGLP